MSESESPLRILNIAGRYVCVDFDSAIPPWVIDASFDFMKADFDVNAGRYSLLDLSPLMRITVFADRKTAAAAAVARTGITGNACIDERERAVMFGGPNGCEILLDGGLLYSVGNKKTPYPKRASAFARILHHELCHVHDYVRAKRVWGTHSPKDVYQGPQRAITSFALSLWQEYYADRESCEGIDLDEVSGKELSLAVHLGWWIERLEQPEPLPGARMAALLSEFGSDRLLEMFRQTCVRLGYVLGTEDRRTVPRTSVHVLSHRLASLGWTEHVVLAKAALDRLYVDLEWREPTCISVLERICRTMFETLGFSLQSNPAGEAECVAKDPR